MSFAELQEEIFALGKKQSDEMREHYKKELAGEEGRIQQQARNLEEMVIDRAQREGKQRAQRIHQVAQLSAKAAVLKAKQNELAATDRLVVAAILEWDEGKVERFISALFLLVPQAQGEITAGAAHEKLVRREAAERKLTVLDKTIPDEGGFVFKGDKTELDVRVSHLVADLFARYRAELAQALF